MSFGQPANGNAAMATEQQLVACIEESLALHMPENARFLVERLVAEAPTEASDPEKQLLRSTATQLLPYDVAHGEATSWPSTAVHDAQLMLVQSNKHLMATCYMRCGQHYRAAAALQGTTGPECRYLLALCYMKLPGKLNDAAAALMPGRDPSQVWTSD